MGNCLFLRARGWGIDRQVRKKLQIPGGMPGGGMVTGRIEPCITSTLIIPNIAKTSSNNCLVFASISDWFILCFVPVVMG